MKWIEVTLGAARHNGTVIESDKLHEYIEKAQIANLELYKSVFVFGEKIKDHMKTNKSPSTYAEPRSIEEIVFDIDKGHDTDAMCHHRAKEFGRRLMEEWKLPKDIVHFYHSGSGYHIVTPDIFGFEPAVDLAKTVKLTLDSAFSGPDTVFYNNTGLIRVVDTINAKTGRYKVYLTHEEMYGELSDIMAIAKEPRDIEIPSFPEFDRDSINKHLIKHEPKIHRPSMDINPGSRNAPCFQAMYEVGEEVGTRHIRIIRLASHYRKLGLSLHATVAIMKQYAPSIEGYEVERQVRSVYNTNYNWGCNDTELKKFCTSNCIYYKNKDYAPLLSTAADLEKKYAEHCRTDYGHSAFNLADIYDLRDEKGYRISSMVYPENFVLLFGDSGLGKTAVAQNIAIKLPKMKILYISTEFGLNLLYRRFVQVSEGWDKERVDAHYKTNDNTLSGKLSHISFFGQGMTTDELENIVKKFSPDLLIIDVVDGIKAPGREVGSVGNDVEVVAKIRQIVEEHKTIVLGVHHLSKHAAENEKGGRKKLTMHSGKGSSSFEQKADIVLGVEGDPNGSARVISTLKGRDIDPFRVVMDFDKTNFQFTKINL